MTTQEFKKAFWFRSTCRKNCLNCKYCEAKTKVVHESMDSYEVISHHCAANKHKFLVHASTICDNWENKYDE